MTTAIGIDLGGTKIAAGIVDESGELLSREELLAVDDAAGVRAQIADLVKQLGTEGVKGVGIGAAGIVDHVTGHYLYGPNTGLRDFDLVPLVTADLGGLPVKLDNDANCAAWAEHRFGIGRGTRDFLCVTLGTGIGGGMVVGGRPYRGAHGGAGEIGHMLVDPEGPPCGCGRRGCWEQFASGLALERAAHRELPTRADSVLHDVAVDGRVTGPQITLAARQGDSFAREVVLRTARWIGWGLASLVNILEPERIAIAGGLAREWDMLAPTALAAMRERTEASDQRPLPEVAQATLGHDAGVVGAALLILGDVG